MTTEEASEHQICFDELFGATKLKIAQPIRLRLIELFAGIGAQAKALENLGVPFEHYRICEFDDAAVKSYNAIHGTNFETSDITQIHASDLGIVNTDTFTYLLTYSFPCQDLSSAGHRKGMQRGSGTRSGLLWEVERLLKECDELPQILLMENVPEVVSAKNIVDFSSWCSFLVSKGYKNNYKILNAKNYGIPQNRDRCYMVSVIGNYFYEFPDAIELKTSLLDILEDEVDEKYYLSEKRIQSLELHKKRHKEKGNGFGWQPIDLDAERERERENVTVAHTLTTKTQACRSGDNFLLTHSTHTAEQVGFTPNNRNGLSVSPLTD